MDVVKMTKEIDGRVKRLSGIQNDETIDAVDEAADNLRQAVAGVSSFLNHGPRPTDFNSDDHAKRWIAAANNVVRAIKSAGF